MAATFKNVELFGGAITVNVPSGFADVSTIRQVPDHQEVYLSATGFSSLIFELGERVSHLATDEEALHYHFFDIVDENDTKKIWSSNPTVPFRHLSRSTPNLSLLATTTPAAPPSPSQPPRPNTPTHVTILLTLIRLVPQATDMVITLNIPHIPGESDAVEEEGVDFEAGKFGRAVEEEGRGIMAEVGGSLVVRDWGLFGGGG